MESINQTITDILSRRLTVKLWEKGTNQRLYVVYGYNTKKMKTNAYIDLVTFEVKCFVECPSQPASWCVSQANLVRANLVKYARYARLIKYHLTK